jgi:hypothetical protein
MGIGDRTLSFSYAERVEFQRVFDLVAERLPVMFQGFWQRWELDEGPPQALVVYADNGSEVLRITRHFTGTYQVAGVTGHGRISYAEVAPSLMAAVQAAGLI